MLVTVVPPKIEILTSLGSKHLKFLERCGRVAYKSEARITSHSAGQFVKMLRESGHESVLEHVSATVRIIGSRSMSHQLVRHRLASYTQESMRFCNYAKKGFQVICPPKIGLPYGPYYLDRGLFFMDEALTDPYPATWFNKLSHIWLVSRADNYREYLMYLADGIPPEDARECLPNATKTEVITTFNLRQWMHVFEERALNKHAQWQIRGLMQDVLIEFGKALPAVFGDQLLRINME